MRRSILGWLVGARASQAVAGEINPVRVVDDAIEDGVGVGWIADQLVPFVEGDLAGDDGRAAAVTFFEDFEEVVTSGGIEGLETPVVEDEQLYAAERALDAGIAAIAAGEREVGEELGNALVERTERLSRQALWPRADESQLLPTPVGPHRIRFSCASIHSPPASLWNSARSRPRGAR